MGVMGCGKSTVGEALQDANLLDYVDGDKLHPQANIDKMASGTPLNDADREPWLIKVGDVLEQASKTTAIGCSALKRGYRDLICSRSSDPIYFVHLSGTRNVLLDRVGSRSGHFMPIELLDSQLATLEPLEADERGGVVDIDQPFEAVVREVARYIKERIS